MKKFFIKNHPKIGIVYRMATPTAVSLAKTLAKWLKEHDCEAYTAPEQKLIPGTKATTKTSVGKMSFMVALGGDGTYLRTIRLIGGKSIPILGVNLGSLGFLTSIRVDDVFSATELTLQNKMKISSRSLLEVKLKKNKKIFALNDVVLERGNLSQLINIDIYHNNTLLSDVKADGLIVATPTGSTAYNLAAGGPILHPEAKSLVLTPISPHSLTSRPVIVPDSGTLKLKLAKKSGDRFGKNVAEKMQSTHLVVDGQKVADLLQEDSIEIRKSQMVHQMITFEDYNYFHLLREKLKFGDRT